jgi:hypothetical protein
MSKFIDDFAELVSVSNHQLWRDVRKEFCKHEVDGWDELSEEDRIRDVRELSRWGDDGEGPIYDVLANELTEIFQRCVLDKFGDHARITAADLASIAIAQLTGLRWDYEDEIGFGISRFQAFVRSELDVDQQGERRFLLNVDVWPWVSLKGEQPKDENELLKLWSSQTGIGLEAEAEPDRKLGYRVTAHLCGACSDHAMRVAEERMGQIVDSVMRTITLGVTIAEEKNGESPSHNKDVAIQEELDKFELPEGTSEKELQPRRPRYAPLAYLTDGDGRVVLQTSLSAYFCAESDKGDSLLQRLRNATILLAHADQIPSDPISLALSFAAIEALVCKKENGVGEQIRQHVPTLLESEPSRRTAKKRDALYDLYELRSQVLHGSALSASRDASSIVRRIAAGVVRAICVWRKHQEMVTGNNPGWEDLYKELHIASTYDHVVIPEVPGLGELLPSKAPK